jgi:putative ABC transport system ATP-binding protein
MVTHELDIASFTKRNIVMRDGVVISDTPVLARSFADEELRKLDEAQQAAQLTP